MQHIYNKGKRTWFIEVSFNEDGSPKNTVTLSPDRSVEVPDNIAEKYTERYPKDIIFGEGSQTKPSGALKARIAELEAENAELRAQLDEKKKPDEKEALTEKAKEIGIEVDGRWSVKKLQEVIDESLQQGS